MTPQGPRSLVVWMLLCAPGLAHSGSESSKMVATETQPGRFVDNGDGTVSDTQTGLMWAARDNGSDVTWDEAKAYCESYRGGGKSDWRMPTTTELRSLYDPSCSQIAQCYDEPKMPIHVTPSIHLSCYAVWSSELQNSSAAWYFGFYGGHVKWHQRSLSEYYRALPVRSINQ